MKTKTETFEIKSGTLVLGDPCYDTNPTFKAKKGTWTAHVVKSSEGNWGYRVKKAIVHHVEFNPADPRIVLENKGFSVDSGQAGVFDGSSYGVGDFYDVCCGETLSKRHYGFTKGGFVTSSGFGDGWYSAEIQKVGGNAVCVELVFFGD